MLADGGDCLADLRAVRDQQPLFGPVASDATAFRVIDADRRRPALARRAAGGAGAGARARLGAGAAPERIVIDIDATLITAHSEKDGAAGTFKRGFGFHPLLAYLDGSREALAGVLRPGNAGANTAADHVAVVELALEQLPREVVEDAEIVVRTDSAAATHEFTDELRAARIRFLMGFDLTDGDPPARSSALPERRGGRPSARTARPREGAWVAELTDAPRPSGWPDGTRVIVRRERPHPGAQLSFTDHDGHRFLATLTDLPATPVELECLHRARANAEDRIRAAKQTGLENLPVPRVRPQRRLARALADRPGPDRLDPTARARRRARHLRTQDAALPAAAHRRPTRLPRPPRDPAPATRLALGRRARRRLRPPRRAPTTRALTPPPADHDHQGGSCETTSESRVRKPVGLGLQHVAVSFR